MCLRVLFIHSENSQSEGSSSYIPLLSFYSYTEWSFLKKSSTYTGFQITASLASAVRISEVDPLQVGNEINVRRGHRWPQCLIRAWEILLGLATLGAGKLGKKIQSVPLVIFILNLSLFFFYIYIYFKWNSSKAFHFLKIGEGGTPLLSLLVVGGKRDEGGEKKRNTV